MPPFLSRLKGPALLCVAHVWWGRSLVSVDCFSSPPNSLSSSSLSPSASACDFAGRSAAEGGASETCRPWTSLIIGPARRSPRKDAGRGIAAILVVRSPPSRRGRAPLNFSRRWTDVPHVDEDEEEEDGGDGDDDDDDVMIVEEEGNLSEEQSLANKIKRRRREASDRGDDASWKDDQPWNPSTLSSSASASPWNDGDDDAAVLSVEQAEALDHIRKGRNVFVTGVAGTGKSLVLRRALRHLAGKYKPNQYVAVAPTGSTAIALGGQTLHSFAGIGVPKTWRDFYRSKSKKTVAAQWRALRVLVLDEVSMVSGEFFDNLSHVVSEIRGDPRPFGGIQLVVCGDFLQLSPIKPRKGEVDEMVAAILQEHVDGDGTALNEPDIDGRSPEQQARDLLFLNRGFCFQSVAWREANFEVVDLQQVFRQDNAEFVEILQQIRTGQVSAHTTNYLREKCERPLPPNEYGIRPTILHSKNRNVARENMADLNLLPGDVVVYPAVDEVQPAKGAGNWAEKALGSNQFFTTCMAEKELHLKIGAQVMLIKNLNDGSKLVNGSRGTVVGFRNVSKNKKDALILPGITKYPVVQFINGLQKVVTPGRFQSQLVGLGTCTRTAIPLKLAWAITTHKAQGLTLDYVIADVGQVFAEAQLYVALSRASDEKGLELRNFSRNRVRANPVALKFHQEPDGKSTTQPYPFWWEADGERGMPMILMSSPGKVRTRRSPKVPQSKVGEKRSLSFDGNDNVGTRVGGIDSEQRSLPSSMSPQSNGLRASALQERTVPELKEMLRKRDLKVSGRKAELIQRLTSYNLF